MNPSQPKVALLLAAALWAAVPGAHASIAAGFNMGTTQNGTDLVRNGEARGTSVSIHGTASDRKATVYASMLGGATQDISLSVSVVTGQFHNEANCSPTVEPATATVGAQSTQLTITYHCAHPGSANMLLVVTPAGHDKIDLHWTKQSGNALDVGTALYGDDVVAVGGARTPYAPTKPTARRDAYIASDTFFLRLHPGELPYTKQETFNAEHGASAITAACEPADVCGPTVAGNATQAYIVKNGDIFSFDLAYNCKPADGQATVTVSIQMFPFAEVTFSLLKYCQNMAGFFVSSPGLTHDVVRSGMVEPDWSVDQAGPIPAHVYSASNGTSVTFSLAATDQVVSFNAPTVDVIAPYYHPHNPLCDVTTSGSAAAGGNLTHNSRRELVLDFAFHQAGYVVVNVTIQLPPYRTVQWTFAKFNGKRPGLTVDANMTLPAGTPSTVIVDGSTQAAWALPTPSVTFGAESVHHVYLFQVKDHHLPLAMPQPISVAISPVEDNGECDPVRFGPVAQTGARVGELALRYDVLFWCKFDRPSTLPTFAFTVHDDQYIPQTFAFEKNVVFLNGLFVGTGPSAQDVFGDGYAVARWQHESTDPMAISVDETSREFYLSYTPGPGSSPCDFGPPEAVANTSHCTPTITGPGAGGGTISPQGDGVAFTVVYNCVHAPGLPTTIAVLIPLSTHEPHSPVMFSFLKYTAVEPPNRPRTPDASSGNGKVDLTITAPFAPGSLVTALNVTYSGAGKTQAHIEKGPFKAGQKVDVSLAGLKNGKKYTFVVTAVDPAGSSPPSKPVTATPSLPWTLIIGGGIVGLLLAVGGSYCLFSRLRRSGKGDDGTREPLVGAQHEHPVGVEGQVRVPAAAVPFRWG